MKKTEQIKKPAPNCGKLDAPETTYNTRKTQRNEPCPCGSGKKFKKCCLE